MDVLVLESSYLVDIWIARFVVLAYLYVCTARTCRLRDCCAVYKAEHMLHDRLLCQILETDNIVHVTSGLGFPTATSLVTGQWPNAVPRYGSLAWVFARLSVKCGVTNPKCMSLGPKEAAQQFRA